MRRLSVLAAAALSVCLVAGCSSGPPTAADFCRTLAQQKAKYLAAYGHPSSNGLEDLVLAISAIGQWVPIFEALQQNSPPSIEPQVANIVDSLKQEEQAASNEASDPLGSIASGLMTGLEASGSWQQVSQYATDHCGSGNAP
jgi:outer membrane murein-binding lipoprotein Lpp